MDWPNEKEKAADASRELRLKGPYGEATKLAVDKTNSDLSAPGRLANRGLVLRSGFAFRATAAPNYASDRRAPKREHRPPATRIASGKGAALRLYLMALAENQIRLRAGAHTTNPLLIDGRGSVSWLDLVTSTAARSTSPSGTYLNPKDKKLRTVTGALRTLESAKLVHLPNAGMTRLLHYGIGRDPFTAAHRSLEQFGLLNVHQVDRWPDGRAMENARSLHRLELLPAAFEEDALTTVLSVLDLAAP